MLLMKDRVQKVDALFLDYETRMISKQDLEKIIKLQETKTKIDNPHNSILLYVSGVSDQFDFRKGRSEMMGGSPPDIDLDFRAQDVPTLLEILREKYGPENIAAIATFGTFLPKGILRKYYSITEGSQAELATLQEMLLPAKFGVQPSLADNVKANPAFATTNPRFFRHAQKLENMITQIGRHAAGIIVSPTPIRDHIPLWTKDDMVVTQFDKDEIEALGFLKFDLLRIDTLSIIQETIRLIKKHTGVEIDPYAIEDGDVTTYEMLSNGFTSGIFQFETSDITKQLLMSVKPKSIFELADITTLIRPGPREAGQDKIYVANKQEGRNTTDMNPAVEKILEKAGYVLMYQEDLMRMCHELAGFDLKETDTIRKVMGKKQVDKIAQYEAKWMEGCAKVGILNEDEAAEWWTNFIGFASYSFNLSHAISYAYLSYISAYLKANYAIYFFNALFSVRSEEMAPKEWRQTAPAYNQEAKRMGVIIHGPDINRSEVSFTIRDGEIYFGLGGIRDVGKIGLMTLMRARTEPFKSIMDFIQRVDLTKLNTKQISALAKAGAFDRMGYVRSELVQRVDELVGYIRAADDYEVRYQAYLARKELIAELTPKLEILKDLKRRSKLKKPNLTLEEIAFLEENTKLKKPVELTEPELPVKPEIKRYKKLSVGLEDITTQAEYLGCYLEQHPVQLLPYRYDDVSDYEVGDYVRIGCVVNAVKAVRTKTGKAMLIIEVDDSTRILELMAFPDEKDKSLKPGDLIIVSGKLADIDPWLIRVKRYRIYGEHHEMD